MNEGKRLASFLSQLKYDDLGDEVIQTAKVLVLDQLGVELAASTKPWSVAVYNYVKGSDRGESTIVGYGDKVKAENAAFVNGVFGHGFELDDTYLIGNTHPGATIIPSALAMGEKQGVSGKEFLLAVVAGYEMIGRVSRSITPSCFNRGFHPVSVVGPLGAAVVSGKILGFNSNLMLDAIGVASSHSSGVTEYAQGGGNVKRIHAGMAAFAGIRAALLAQAGITGPSTILEGNHGLCHVFADSCNIDIMTANLGAEYCVTDISFKKHCCCYQIQAALDATSNIVRKNNIGHEDIAEIVMGTNHVGVTHVGTIREPKEVTAAQFSAAFSLAMCVVKGSNTFRDYTEENLADPDIKALASKVKVIEDAEIQAIYPAKRAVRMTIKLKKGQSFQERLDDAKGTPANPMTRAEVDEKFRNLATLIIPNVRAEKVIKMVNNLEDLDNIQTLCKLLVR